MNSKVRRTIVLPSLIVVLVLLPVFVNDVRWQLVMNLICLNAVAALGLYSIASLRLVSFAQAAFYGIGSYVVSIFLLRTEVPFVIAWVTGALVAALTAAAIGTIVLRMKGAYFFLVTLALNQFIVWVFHSWDSVTGGYNGLVNFPVPSLLDSPGKLYYLSLALLVATFLYIITVENSRLGLAIKATAENELMVESYGISSFRIKMMNWITCCFFTGMAGGLNALLMGSSFPTMFGMLISLHYIVFLAFGGILSPFGPIIGSMAITLISEFLRPIREFEPPLYGLILILVLVFLPGGLMSLIRRGRS